MADLAFLRRCGKNEFLPFPPHTCLVRRGRGPPLLAFARKQRGVPPILAVKMLKS